MKAFSYLNHHKSELHMKMNYFIPTFYAQHDVNRLFDPWNYCYRILFYCSTLWMKKRSNQIKPSTWCLIYRHSAPQVNDAYLLLLRVRVLAQLSIHLRQLLPVRIHIPSALIRLSPLLLQLWQLLVWNLVVLTPLAVQLWQLLLPISIDVPVPGILSLNRLLLLLPIRQVASDLVDRLLRLGLRKLCNSERKERQSHEKVVQWIRSADF